MNILAVAESSLVQTGILKSQLVMLVARPTGQWIPAGTYLRSMSVLLKAQ
jgi:hypothetical protein